MTIENFIIDALQTIDAHQLYQFIKSNNERLKSYFPRTLSDNETIEKTTEYIAIKNKKIAEKTNFTFAIRNNLEGRIQNHIASCGVDDELARNR